MGRAWNPKDAHHYILLLALGNWAAHHHGQQSGGSLGVFGVCVYIYIYIYQLCRDSYTVPYFRSFRV